MKNNNNELMDNLIHKVEEEQKTYSQKLLALPAEEMLEHMYAYAVREDIVLKLQFMMLPTAQIKRLLKLEHPLEEIFSKWEDYEEFHMALISKMIKDTAKR